MEKNLFVLLRLGLNNSVIDKEDYSEIAQFTHDQWKNLISMSFKQGVEGVVFDGAMCLLKYDKNISLGTPELRKLRLQWSTNIIALEDRNNKQIQCLKEMGNIWNVNGCRMLLFKGQANGLYYPYPIHRSTGDVDCYLFEGYERGNSIAKSIGANVDASWYKHSKICYKNEMFENHQYLITTRGGKKSKLLNQTLCSLLEEDSFATYPDSEVLLPPVMFNALFLTCHGFAHFLSEGMRLKQILDWAMFLKAEQHNVEWNRLYQICDDFKYLRYLHAMNQIAVSYLGVEIANKQIQLESPFFDKIMHSVLYDDDFVFSSGNGGWKDRFHLLKNMYKYRWKYQQIYQRSIVEQLYYHVSGFLFHTEG